MSEKRIFATQRQMAWERAKGELRAMLVTYWDEQQKFDEINKAMSEFIKKVEDQGLHE